MQSNLSWKQGKEQLVGEHVWWPYFKIQMVANNSGMIVAQWHSTAILAQMLRISFQLANWTWNENMSLPDARSVAGDRDPMQSRAKSALTSITARDVEDSFWSVWRYGWEREKQCVLLPWWSEWLEHVHSDTLLMGYTMNSCLEGVISIMATTPHSCCRSKLGLKISLGMLNMISLEQWLLRLKQLGLRQLWLGIGLAARPDGTASRGWNDKQQTKSKRSDKSDGARLQIVV